MEGSGHTGFEMQYGWVPGWLSDLAVEQLELLVWMIILVSQLIQTDIASTYRAVKLLLGTLHSPVYIFDPETGYSLTFRNLASYI